MKRSSEQDDEKPAAVVRSKQPRISPQAQVPPDVTAVWTTDFDCIVDKVMSWGFLTWYEATRVGEVNRMCRQIWIRNRDELAYWNSLLQHLNTISSTSICWACYKRYAPPSESHCECTVEEELHNWWGWEPRPFGTVDPRCQEGYEAWTARRKCQKLASYHSRLITRLHQACLQDPVVLPSGSEKWHRPIIPPSQYNGEYPEDLCSFSAKFPRRYALLANIELMKMAQDEMDVTPKDPDDIICGGFPNHFAEVFLGEACGPMYVGYADFEFDFADMSSMLPGDDATIAATLRQKCYPKSESRAILGPLVSKVSIFAPFFFICPLDENVGTNFEFLELEPMESDS